MSELRLETLSMPTAAVGPENPLPPLFTRADAHQVADDRDADDEMRRNIAYGRVSSVLPYLTQDGYGRTRSPADHRVAVLENDLLRATFLIEAGGRLWSLVDKTSGRELLHRNSVFQPANLALRNAWFAGGVEWNIGTIGHTPTTCEPLHAVRVDLPDGTPVLRMYEFERLREVVYQIDAWLPDDSPVLLVHVRITNPGKAEVPMYWWSNVAVPQRSDVRVVAPADSAWQFGYDATVRKVPMPVLDGVDRTYTTRAADAADYFFDLDVDERRWIAALDAAGTGLVQASTERLRGRKLFLWGTSPGGTHWQEWLSGGGADYLEIQAGLARTQLEHVPMPGHTVWAWVEAYGRLDCDASSVHSDDWRRARRAVADGVDQLIPAAVLDDALTTATAAAHLPPVEVLGLGSGWGALERRLREQEGDTSLDLPGTPFDASSLGAPQDPWLRLLENGELPGAAPQLPPVSYQVSTRWVRHLETATGWSAQLHLGVVRAHAGDLDGARAAWTRSIAIEPTAWAWRNLAALAWSEGSRGPAIAQYARAHALRRDLAPLTLELVTVLLLDMQGAAALAVIDESPPEQRSLGRFRWAEASAALLTGDLDRVGRLLDDDFVVPDLREGELSLHELWFDYQAALLARDLGREVDDELRARVRSTFAVPRHLDFRMGRPGSPLPGWQVEEDQREVVRAAGSARRPGVRPPYVPPETPTEEDDEE